MVENKVGKPLFSRSRLTFVQRQSLFGGTSFQCRGCDNISQGCCDGTFEQPGWRRIVGIDGPDAICPTCVSETHWVEYFFEDGYEHVGLSLEEPEDAIPNRHRERFCALVGIPMQLEEGVIVGPEWAWSPCDWSRAMQRAF